MDQQTVTQRLRTWIDETSTKIFLRRDFAHLGSARQLSRALKVLQFEEFLARAGHGIYLRPDEMSLETAVRAVRERLGSRSKRLVTISGVTVEFGETRARLNQQTLLDAKKLASAMRVVQCCTVDQIRRKSLANIERWNSAGTWVSAHE